MDTAGGLRRAHGRHTLGEADSIRGWQWPGRREVSERIRLLRGGLIVAGVCEPKDLRDWPEDGWWGQRDVQPWMTPKGRVRYCARPERQRFHERTPNGNARYCVGPERQRSN